MTTPRILIIAGSDSGGGAGVQADIKTVTMLGGHAMTAITAITAQNTLGVDAVMAVPAEMVLKQIDAVLSDIGVDAVKIGMIGLPATARAVAARLDGLDVPIVFDPVMVATSGSVLADEATIAAFERLTKLCRPITPNWPELAALTGLQVSDEESALAAARALSRRAGTAVLAKGGHAEGHVVVDLLVDVDGAVARWADERIDTVHTHGTGCTLASAIVTFLARGASLPIAVSRAREVVRIALREAPGFGGGHGPMGHQAVRLDVVTEARPMLNQVTIPALDYERSVAFYQAFGLAQIVDSPPRYARFEASGGVTLSIHVHDAPVPSSTVIYFEVSNLEHFIAHLQAAEISVDSLPVDEPWLWREARLQDPAGNPICIYRAGQNRRFPPWRLSSA